MGRIVTSALVLLLLAAAAVMAADQAVPGAAGGQQPNPNPNPNPRQDKSQPIVVVDADRTTGVKVTTSRATTVLRIPLDVMEPVTALTASVDDFVGQNGTRVTPTVKLSGTPADQPINLTQKDRPILEVAATFTALGEYKSYIVLVHAGGRMGSVPLVVTRQREEASVEIAGVEIVQAEKWLTADAQIRFIVRETAGRQATLYPPVLEGFSRKESEKVRTAARYSGITVDGTPPATPATESFVVEPQRARQVVVTAKEILDPGEYSGTLRVSSSNGTPATKEVTVLVKSSKWVAGIWIFLGVFASFLIRRYVKEQRPKLQALRRVRYAEDDLSKVEQDAQSPPVPAAKVFQGIRDRLARIERTLNDGTAKDGASADLDEVDRKVRVLPDWITTGRRLEAVQPASIVESPRTSWKALADSYFLKPGSGQDLAAELVKVEAAIKTSVLASIKDFSDRVASYEAAHPASVTAIHDEVRPRLEAAKRAADNEDWVGMTTALREARLAYAKVLAATLDRILTNPTPREFSPADWEALQVRVRNALADIRQASDPDRAVELYDNVNAIYMNEVISRLGDYVKGLENTPGVDAQAVQDAKTALAAATLATQKRDWDAARTAYETAMANVTSIIDARAKPGIVQLRGQTSAPATESVPAGAAVGTVNRMAALAQRPKLLAEQISDMLARYDMLLNVGMLLIACVVGVSALWAGDPVWGGPKAYMTAFLWGLGLHQIAGSTLDGLPGVTKKLTE